ncbi:uncharacterized protein LAJ45_05797 [Morchella importuna]|uniref:uncharacterized protein n=1 Tax=Morchella importuna TaxID=1174673 RepID=UPI001E8EE3FE|nr:uncharacterized protein LAJ45_05797 [Morchella importuna]KAH8150111.1 hypothetical protein LAJ45_05797 [Morchella importuna]
MRYRHAYEKISFLWENMQRSACLIFEKRKCTYMYWLNNGRVCDGEAESVTFVGYRGYILARCDFVLLSSTGR